jgi:hypothetical protein
LANRKTLNEHLAGSVLFNALNAYNIKLMLQMDFSLVPSTTGLGTEIINPLADREHL